MDRGRTFYICLFCGLITLALLLVNVNLPAQLVFETKPYARVVLSSGDLKGWTAEMLDLNPAQFEMVKNNYAEYLKQHRVDRDSESEDSEDLSNEQTYVAEEDTPTINRLKTENNDDDDDDDDRRRRSVDDDEDDDDDDEEEEKRITARPTTRTTATPKKTASVEEETSESSDNDGDEESDDDDIPLEQKLKDIPLRQTVSMGLFHAKVCDESQRHQVRCHTVSVNEAILELVDEASFMENDINMPMWNNLRVETLFALIACVIGLVFLFAALKPCCDNHHLPVYLGALAFFVCGVLIFIPIVRLLLVTSDFEQNLLADMNITTKTMTSWSLLASGIASPFALMAAFSLIATKWYKFSMKWYHILKSKAGEPVTNGNPPVIHLKTMLRANTQSTTVEQASEGNLYENLEEESNLLTGKVEKEKLGLV